MAAATEVLIVIVRDTISIIGLLAWMFYLNWFLTTIVFTISSTRDGGTQHWYLFFSPLAIAASIVNRHRGEIGVESEAGRGSTFWFTLPLSQQN